MTSKTWNKAPLGGGQSYGVINDWQWCFKFSLFPHLDCLGFNIRCTYWIHCLHCISPWTCSLLWFDHWTINMWCMFSFPPYQCCLKTKFHWEQTYCLSSTGPGKHGMFQWLNYTNMFWLTITDTPFSIHGRKFYIGRIHKRDRKRSWKGYSSSYGKLDWYESARGWVPRLKSIVQLLFCPISTGK